ncbi:MAG: putative Ig domain-containing protein [Pirellulaceae bacterium]
MQNLGTGDAPVEAWTDAVIVSKNEILGDWDDEELVRLERTGGLGAGASYQGVREVLLPPRFAGRFHLFVITDVDEGVFEDNSEANNTREGDTPFDVVIMPYADLVVTSIEAPATAFSGQPLELAWTVTNQGIGPTDVHNWSDYIYLAHDPAGQDAVYFERSGVDVLWNESMDHLGQLAAGATYTHSASLVLPEGLEGPVYVVISTAVMPQVISSYYNVAPYAPVFEFIYTDNNRAVSASLVVELSPPADLLVTDVTAPVAAFEDSIIDVGWTVRNAGTGIASGSWVDRVWLQNAADPDADPIELGAFIYNVPLDADATYMRQETVRIPAYVLGTYYLVVATDHGNGVFEHTGEDNNTTVDDAALVVAMKPRPDLQVVSVAAPATVDPEGSLAVEFVIINQSTIATTQSHWVDRVYLSLDNLLGSDDLLVATVANQSALAPGESYLSVSPAGIVPRHFRGDMFVIVETDADGQMDEWPAEENNTLAVAIHVTELPLADLVVGDVAVPAQALAGSEIEVRFTVTNLGLGETDRDWWAEQIWLTADKDLPTPSASGLDMLITSFEHRGSLEVGAGYDVIMTVTLPADLESGRYYITPWTDPYRFVAEDTLATNINPDDPDEIDNNNYKARAIDVIARQQDLPDLVVDWVTATPTAQGGQEFTVTYRVQNQGTAKATWNHSQNGDSDPVPSFWYDDLRLVSDLEEYPARYLELIHVLVISPNGADAGAVRRITSALGLDLDASRADGTVIVLDKPLGPGESYTHSLTLPLSPSAEGLYAVVTTDPPSANSLKETDETNNRGYGITSVTPVPADLRVTAALAEPIDGDQAYSGESIRIRYTVTNVGAHPVWPGTEFWKEHLWISADFLQEWTISGRERSADRATYLGENVHVNDEPLQPGESYDVVADFALPPGIGGDYFVYILLNSYDKDFNPDWWPGDRKINSYELAFFQSTAFEDPHNNLQRVALPVVYREPDLVVTMLEVPVSATSGDIIQISYEVTNRGPRATRANGWRDGIILSRDAFLDEGDVLLSSLPVQRSEPLGPGKSYAHTSQIQLPESIEGSFYILVFTDSVASYANLFYTPSSISDRLPGILLTGTSLSPDDRVSHERRAMARGNVWEFEAEANNLVAAALQVNLDPPPDLQVTALSAPEHVERGQQFDVTWMVTNLGGDTPPNERTWENLIYLSRDEVLDLKADRYLASWSYALGLAAGESYTRTLSVMAPKDLLGPYYVFVIADPVRYLPRGQVVEGSSEDSHEYNNDRASAVPLLIEFPPPSDLEVTEIAAAGTAVSGTAVPISWTVTNSASKAARGTWSDSVYLSSDAVWDIRDRLIGRVAFNGTLETGSSYTSTLTQAWPAVVPGDYRIIVRTDIYDQVYEGDGEVGNTAVSTYLARVKVAELVVGVPFETNLSAGEERLFQVNVPQDKTLAVTAGSPSELALHEVFLRHSAVPTNAAFEAVSEGGLDQVVTAVVPSTEPGVYYVLLRGYQGPVGGGVVTVLAELVPLVITDVHTDVGGDGRYVTTTIRGAQFHEQAITKLVRPGFGEYEPVDYQVIDSTTIVATFDFTGASHGLYDVKVINPNGDQAVVPYRFLIERAIEPEVTIGLGGPRLIEAGDVGRFSVALANTGNIDAPYVFFEVGIPNMGLNERVYNLPYAVITTTLRGDPAAAQTQDVPWARLDPVVNTSDTPGYLLAPGYVLDEHAGGYAGFSFNVATYPLLNELLSYDWNRVKEMAYAVFPELAATDALQAGPAALNELAPGLYEAFIERILLPCQVQQFMAFQFPIVAAATTLTRDEFVDHVVAESLRLRDAILEDEEAASALRAIAADKTIWQQLYLTALEEAGILRSEDETPPARQNPVLLSLMATLSAGILIGPAGSDVRSSGDLVGFFDQIRQWYGHEPTSAMELVRLQTCGPLCGTGERPFLTQLRNWPLESDYDLGLQHPTHFEAFRVYVPHGSIGHPKGLVRPGALTDYLAVPGEQSDLVSLEGPFAFDTGGFLPLEETLPFTVRFQTDRSASTFSHEIRVVSQLDDEINARSFRLGDLQVGDIRVHIPEDRSFFQNDFDFTTTKGFLLRVSAGIDPESRQATWLLQAIDPLTGELLADPNNGLLPPNDATGLGAGFVSYSVALDTDAVTGARLDAQARVITDNAPPEDTVTLSYLVDARAPVTTLSVVPLSGTTPTYQVTWQAVDESTGSGVRHVTLYVAADGGDFTIWQRQRSEAAGTEIFLGEPGHAYEFLAIASDVAGNRETPALAHNVPDDGTRTNLGGTPVVSETTPANFGVVPAPNATPSTNPLFVEVAKGVPSALAQARRSEFSEVLRPFVARAFATGMAQSHADIGPLAIVETPDGSILVSGGASRNEIYQFDIGGGTAGQAVAELDYPIFNMAFDAEGRLWATTGGGPLLELDPATFQILHEYADGITLALAVEPATGLIYVSTFNGIDTFDPETESFQHYSRDGDLRVGSLAFDAEGALWATTWPDRQLVVRFNERARAETMLAFDADIDSIAFGQAGTQLEGLLLISHVEGPRVVAGSSARAGSELTLVDLATLQQVSVARGGTRGDVVLTTSDGRILVSQSHQVDILYPASAPVVVASSPPDASTVALPLGTITVTFDQAMYVGGSLHPASVTNVDNYHVVGVTSGPVAITSVVYDADSHTAVLFPQRLEPDQYALRVQPAIASADGLKLAETYAATFLAVSDFSTLVDVEFSHARSNRAEQTVSYDVKVTNTGDYDLLLPVLLVLDPAVGYAGVPHDATGQTADGSWIVDLSDTLPSNGRLQPGQSTAGHTVIIDNQGNWHVDYTHGAFAFPTVNAAPSFDSQPVEFAAVGQPYVYQAAAHDPDGVIVVFMLYQGPAGMTVDPVTGLVEWTPTAMASAQTAVVLNAYDSRGGRSAQRFVVDVAGGNRKPVLAPLPETIEVSEGDPLELVLTVDDPDDDLLLLGADNLPPGARFDAARRVLTWIPDNDAAGTYPDVRFSVTDGLHTVQASFTILVLPADQGPSLLTPSPRTVREGERLRFYLDSGDPDGDSIRHFSNLLPPGASLHPQTGLFDWMPDYDQAGAYTFPLSVISRGKTATVEAAVTVLNVNGPPEFDPLDTWLGYEGEAIKFRPLAMDPDHPSALPPVRGSAGELVMIGSGASSLTYTVTGLPAGAQFDAEAVTFFWEPGYSDAGEYFVSFTATDDGDGAGPALACDLTTRIVVHNSNRSPEIAAVSNVTVRQGDIRMLAAEAVDPDGNLLTLSATNALTGYALPDFIAFVDNGDGTGTFAITPRAGDRGDYIVSLAATDDGDAGQSSVSTDNISFVVTVEAENDPPVLDYIGDKIAVVGFPFELVVRASDLDDEQFTWTIAGLPAAATLTPGNVPDTAVLRWLPAFADAGRHSVTLAVSDGGNGDAGRVATDVQTITLTVRASNQAPVLTEPGTLVVREGETLSIPLVASDADGDALTFSAENLPAGAWLDPESGILAWTPHYEQAGTYPGIVIWAGDGHRSDTATFNIDVSNTNRAPRLDPLAQQFGREGSAVQFALASSDADGDPVWYRSTNLPVGAVLNLQTGRFSWTPGFTDAGEQTITFEAVDPRGAAGTLNVVVEIENQNRAPSITATDHAVALGQLLQFSVIGYDPDPGATLTYSAEGLPEGASLDPLTGQFAWAPQPGQAREHVVTMRVSDGQSVASRAIVIMAAVAPSPVRVWIELTPSFAASPGDTTLVHVIADSLADVTQIGLLVDGQQVALDAQGRATISAQQAGKRQITATAVDADGFVGHASAVMRVLDPTDDAAPVVALSSALSLGALRVPIEIEGTVADRNLDFWRLEIAPYGSNEFVVIAAGDSSVNAGVLGNLVPATLRNGFYQLRLTAQDLARRTSVAERIVEVSTPAKPVAYLRSVTDLEVNLGGTKVALTRVYDSLARESAGALGYGWRLAPRDTQVQTNVPRTGREHLGVYGALREDTRLYLTLPSGERVGFAFAPETVEVSGLTFYRPAWQADPGVEYTLHSIPTMLAKAGGRFHDYESGQPYHPQNPFFDGPDYTLVALDGARYEIDTLRGVVAQIASTGERLLYSDSGIITSTGEAIQFVYDAQGRIDRAISFDGTTVVYLYDEAGNLASVRNLATGQYTSYGYHATDSHLLTAAVDSDGTGEAVIYSESDSGVPQTIAIAAHLAGVVQFTGTSETGSLPAGTTDRYTFAVRDSEIASVGTGEVLFQVWIDATSSGFEPAVPVIDGLESLSTHVAADRSMGIFSLSHAGLYQVLVSGSDGTTTGSYELRLRVAGDINADGLVDGVDSALLAAAQGKVVGDPGYLAEADLDASDSIDAEDTLILIANYGFIANRPPAVRPVLPALLTHQDLAIAFPIENVVTDPDGDAVHYQLVGVEHGTVTLNANGQTVLFVPEPSFVGAAHVRLIADDGANASNEISWEVNVSAAPLLGIEIVERTPQLEVGDVTKLVVVGDFADQEDVPLLGRYVTYTSSNPAAVVISSVGLVQAKNLGNSVLLASRGPWQAATVARVGTPTDAEGLYLTTVGVDVYPDSLTLPPGEERQIIVRIGAGDSISNAGAGTRYVAGHTGILSVRDDGLVTAIAEGTTTLTIFNGPAEATIPIRVVSAQVGSVQIDMQGGVVRGTDGSLLAIAPGAVSTPITASITPWAESDLGLPLPRDYTFAGAFELDLAGATLAYAAQLVIPVSGVAPGQVVHFFQKKLLTERDGTQKEWWILVDSGIVGDDGRARTTSPPYPGFSRGGQYVCAQSDAPEFEVRFGAGIQLGTTQLSTWSSYVTLGPSLMGFFSPSADVYTINTPRVNGFGITYRVYVEDRTDEIPYYEQEVTYEVPEGVTHVEVDITAPDLPRSAPVITGVEYVIVAGEPKIVVHGQRLDRAHTVAMELADRNRYWYDSAFEDVTATSVTVPWPEDAGLIMGVTDIYMVAPGGVTSNRVQIRPPGGLGFMSALDEHGPFVAAFETNIPDDANRLAAKIFLGDAGEKTIQDTVTSVDGTRVYAAIQRGAASDPWGGVAVIDAMTFKQVDEDWETLGDNFIKLPGGADALALAMSPRGDFLYVSEWGGTVHVLDIRPDSPDFHKVVQSIPVVTDRDLSQALAVSSDGRRLYVGIAEQTGPDGQLAVVNIDPADRPADPSADLTDATANPRYWHRVLGTFTTIHTPIQIVPTAHPDKLAVTCAFRPHKFYALTVTNDRPDPLQFQVQLNNVATNLYFPDLRLSRASYDINDPWSVAVMPDLSYAFVSDLSWSVTAHGITHPGANVGIIRDPFGLTDGPLLMAATTPIQDGDANSLALSPDGSRLFVSYSGIGEVLVMDTTEMRRAVETEPHLTFIHTPLDQVPGYDVHITPITTGGWAGGFSFQRPNESPQTSLDDAAVLLTKDYTPATGAAGENTYRITIPNTADPTRSQSPMLVTMDIEGNPGEFLIDERGRPLQTHYEWLVAPGSDVSFEMRAKTLLDHVDQLNADAIYGARIHVQAFEQHTTGFALLVDDATHYVYRYVDAMDATLSALASAAYQAQTDRAHTDRILEMPDTASDGQGGVVRGRALDVHGPRSAKPQFEIVDPQHFRFRMSDETFIFDPQAVGTDLRTEIIVKTPEGTEAGRLALRGDGVMQELFIDRNKLIEALEHLANTTPTPIWLEPGELALIDTPSKRLTIADRVIERSEFLLQNYDSGWRVVDTVTPDAVRFDVFGSFQPALETPARAALADPVLGYAFMVDNVDLSSPAQRKLVPDLVAHRTDLAASQASFLLSEILNEQPEGHIDVYLDRYFEYDSITSTQALVNTLGQVVNHELGHNLGMNHTLAYVSAVARIIAAPAPTNSTFAVVGLDSSGVADPAAISSVNDIYVGWTVQIETGANAGQEASVIDFDGATKEFTIDVPFMNALAAGDRLALFHGYAIPSEDVADPGDMMAQGQDYDGELRWDITDEAMRMALGTDWTATQATAAIDYFAEYTNRTASLLWGDAPSHPLDYDPEDPYFLGPTPHTGPSEERAGGILWFGEPSGSTYLEAVDFGSVLVEVGQEAPTREVLLRNVGDEDIAIFDVRPEAHGSDFAIAGVTRGTVVPAGESLSVIVTFTPTHAGDAMTSWTIYSDALNGPLELEVAGVGLSPHADLRSDLGHNNLGGAIVGDQLVRAENRITLANQGSLPLSIYDVVVGEGNGDFTVEGLPTGTSFSNPLVLNPGESRELSVSFLPHEIGLRRGFVHVFTNDPIQPLETLTVIGTGMTGAGPSLGNDFVAIGRTGAPLAYAKSDASGNFPLSLGPGTAFSYTAFDPATGLVSYQDGRTAMSGQFLWTLSSAFFASTVKDSDGDGLPDDVELAIGSSADNTDTNADGWDDYVSIMRGIDPLARSAGTGGGTQGSEFGFNDSGWRIALDGTSRTPSSSDMDALDLGLLEPLLAVAQANWSDVGADSGSFDAVRFRIADLPGLALGHTVRTAQDEYLVTIDVDAGGYGWFVDATPNDADEFYQVTDSEFSAANSSPAYATVDLLTVITHEIGHVLGLADRARSEGLIMSALLPLGIRRSPTASDLNGPHLDASRADYGWYNGVDPPGNPQALLNGDFAVSDPDDPAFGWTLRGDASVIQGDGVLGESGVLNAGISQVFLVPEGARHLWFDVVGLDLHGSTLNPPDAFEVALLNPVTMLPLVGSADGLSGTDALLNMQASGEVFFAAAVNLPFSTASGETTELTFPFTVEIALPDTLSTTEVALYFDLLGFGDLNSSAKIDNVRFAETPSLTLSLVLDPDTDSGTVGDGLTNFTLVNLIGRTDPGASVQLDVDGDGFDDGTLTADVAGHFVFVDVSPAAGENRLRAQATSGGQTVTVGLTVTLDTQRPTGTLIAPMADSLVNQDLGYVDIQWIDAGQAGLDSTTFDLADVTISGVQVERVQIVADGHVRYWYDGHPLADGVVEINVVADAVSDRAGNRNAATMATFTLDIQQPTGTLVTPIAGSLINQDSGYVDIQWTDAGLAGLDSTTFDIADVTITGVAVDHIEIREGGVVRYWYDGSMITNGVIEVHVLANAVADLAGNRNGATMASFTLDTYSPTGILVAPIAGSMTNLDLGYVDIEWTDAGLAGMDPATFDQTDVTITGVQVERVQIIGGGLVRYWYDGHALVDGLVEIDILADAVSDHAGNRNATTRAAFTLDTQGPIGLLVNPVAGTTVTLDAGWIEVRWNDEGLAGLDATSFDARNVTITGVTVERAEYLGGGQVRYWYGEGGQVLPGGDIQVRLVPGTVKDKVGNANVAGEAVFVFAATGSISGYVYVDVNNNGIKDAVEMRLPNVPVTIEGPITRTVVTDADGCYLLDQLPAGSYSIRQLQPTAFIDGQETQGLPRTGRVGNDFFQDVALEPNMRLEEYNFGERGLRAELISKRFYLASSPPPSAEIAQYLTITDDNRWFAFQAPYDALMTTEVAGESVDTRIELYTASMMPVKLTHGVSAQTASIIEDQQYVLYIGGNGSEIPATIRLRNPGPPGAFHNAANPLDVNADEYVSPLDALLVINELNRRGSRVLTGNNDTGCYVDVSGDDFVSPRDALLVINSLNQDNRAEGESPAVSTSGEASLEFEDSQALRSSGVVTPRLWTAATALRLPLPGRELWREAPVAAAPVAATGRLPSARGSAVDQLAEQLLSEFGTWDEEELDLLFRDLAADVVLGLRGNALLDELFGKWR